MFGRYFSINQIHSLVVIIILMARYIIGIDEVGRGPLAGPIVVCAFCLKAGARADLDGIRDSKKMSAKQRKKWEQILNDFKKKNKVTFAFASVSPGVIDRIGIGQAGRLATERALSKLSLPPKQCRVFLDGGLSAPEEFCFQKTVIRGDQKIKVVSCASVLAKVRRDRMMRRLAKIYPEYGFEKHKGYGTRVHYSKIKKLGSSPIHRRSFLKNISPLQNL